MTPPGEKKWRPKAGKALFWQKKIQNELEARQGDVQQGPWDPFADVFESTADLKSFFSGHQMRKNCLRDHERHARWAIREALNDYEPESLRVTNEATLNNSAIYGKSGDLTLERIRKAVTSEGQQDIDAEDLYRSNIKDADLEHAQSVSGAAQALLASSHNSLGPPVQACVKYLRLKRVGPWSRSNMTLWKNPKYFPGLEKKESSKGLLDTQITAIVFLLSRLLGDLPKLKTVESPTSTRNRLKLKGPRYSGAILADSMGLRKTLTIVALLELMTGRDFNVLMEEGVEKYYPILILTPNLTVAAQWVEELLNNSSEHTISQIFVSGGSASLFRDDPRVEHLDAQNFNNWPSRHNIWDPTNKKSSRAVLLMSIDTWSRRTCLIKKEGWCSTFTALKRKFSIVAIDEAHRLKAQSTRAARSVLLLEKKWTILITATPCLNTPSDLFNLGQILWTAPEKWLKDEQPGIWNRIESNFEDLESLKLLHQLESWDDLQLVAGRPALLAKLLCRGRWSRKWDIQQIRAYLVHFEKLAILRRGPGASIPWAWGHDTERISLEGILPTVRNYTVNIQQDPDLAAAYQSEHLKLLIELVKRLNRITLTKGRAIKKERAEQEKLKSVLTLYRELQIASASLDIYRLDKLLTVNGFGTKAEHIRKMRQAGVTFRQFGQFLLEPNDPEPRTAMEWLKVALRRSPILRYILHYLRENILNRASGAIIKKVLITEAVPILAFFYELVMQLLGLNCRVLHADLNQEERKQLVTSFNSSKDNSCQILIQMYSVGFAGSNLHHNCSRVLVASQAYSLAVQSQAVHRVVRVSQQNDVEVCRLQVTNTYHSFQESRQVEKLLPELGARVQGPMNQTLVDLLNLFQREVEDAWNSEEGKNLVKEKSLLSESEETTDDIDPTKANADDVHPGKKRRMSDGKPHSVTIKEEDSDIDDTRMSPRLRDIPPAPPLQTGGPSRATPVSGSGSNPKKRARATPSRDGPGAKGWFPTSEHGKITPFLGLRTRHAYYQEFKALPRSAKRQFSHKKNKLRRLLSYRNDVRGSRPWTPEDLDEPAVLERALELVLRIRLGAGEIEMLPIPQIDFSLVPRGQLLNLQRAMGGLDKTDQDIEAAREKADAKTKDPVKDALKGVDVSESLSKIDEALEREARFGGIPKVKKETSPEGIADKEPKRSVDDIDIPAIIGLQERGTVQGVGEQKILTSVEESDVEEIDDDNGDPYALEDHESSPIPYFPPEEDLMATHSGLRDSMESQRESAEEYDQWGNSKEEHFYDGAGDEYDDLLDEAESKDEDEHKPELSYNVKYEDNQESLSSTPFRQTSTRSHYIKLDSEEPIAEDDSDIELVSVRPVRYAPQSPKVKHEDYGF